MKRASTSAIRWTALSPGSELTADGNISPRDILKEGDEIEVEVLKVNDGNGNVILSKKAVDERLAKDKKLAEINQGEPFEATVKEAVKGGVLANVDGITVFIPGSQLRERGYVRDLSQYVGKTFKVKALEVDVKKRRVVASRAQVLKQEREEKEEKFWSNIHEGDIVKGHCTPYYRFRRVCGCREALTACCI